MNLKKLLTFLLLGLTISVSAMDDGNGDGDGDGFPLKRSRALTFVADDADTNQPSKHQKINDESNARPTLEEVACVTFALECKTNPASVYYQWFINNQPSTLPFVYTDDQIEHLYISSPTFGDRTISLNYRQSLPAISQQEQYCLRKLCRAMIQHTDVIPHPRLITSDQIKTLKKYYQTNMTTAERDALRDDQRAIKRDIEVHLPSALAQIIFKYM